MPTWLLICIGLTTVIVFFFSLLALLDRDAIPGRSRKGGFAAPQNRSSTDIRSSVHDWRPAR
jgi:hypothetical protein